MTREQELERCEFQFVHEDVVNAVQGQMPKDEVLYDLADLFKVFGDSTRIKILYALFEAELCVCDIAQLLAETQPAVSNQRRVVTHDKRENVRREGKNIFYSLADDHVRSIINQGIEHVEE